MPAMRVAGSRAERPVESMMKVVGIEPTTAAQWTTPFQVPAKRAAPGAVPPCAVPTGAVAQPLRAALTGKAVSPPVFDVMAALGREEALARIRDQAQAS